MGRGDTLDLGSWCILRMASADTLHVFRSLEKAGYRVWTPVEKRFGRRPRTRAQFDKEFALMPSYVFANVAHLDDLLRMAMVPSKDHPRFSMFRHLQSIPLVADEQLATLRVEEERVNGIFERLRRRGRKGPRIEPGTVVKMTDGPFMGLSGVVEDQRGQFTMVRFDGFDRPLKIASLLLGENVARAGESDSGTAALAA